MSAYKAAAEQGAAMSYKLRGVQSLLLSPPVDNPRNVIDFSLYVGNYKVRPAHNRRHHMASGLCAARTQRHQVILCDMQDLGLKNALQGCR